MYKYFLGHCVLGHPVPYVCYPCSFHSFLSISMGVDGGRIRCRGWFRRKIFIYTVHDKSIRTLRIMYLNIIYVLSFDCRLLNSLFVIAVSVKIEVGQTNNTSDNHETFHQHLAI